MDELAQAGGKPLVIGKVDKAAGAVTVRHEDGATSALQSGDSIYRGDHIETGADGKVGVTFIDKSTFSLGPKGHMVMDEMVFDPAHPQASHSQVNALQGAFSFVSGEIAKTAPGAMEIKTPVMTIGIRGTAGAGIAAAEGAQNTVSLLRDPDGNIGQITISNASGSVTLNIPSQTINLSSFVAAPPAPVSMSAQDVQRLYGNALSANPSPPQPPTPADHQGAQQPQQQQQNKGGEAQPTAAEQALAEAVGAAQPVAEKIVAAIVAVLEEKGLAEQGLVEKLLVLQKEIVQVVVEESKGPNGNQGLGEQIIKEKEKEKAQEQTQSDKNNQRNDTEHPIQDQTPTNTGPIAVSLDNSSNYWYGTAAIDLLYALGGDDHLDGKDGDDTIYGGDGNDYLVGGAGKDVFDGGAGSNTYAAHYATQKLVINLATGVVAQDGFGSTDTVSNIDGVYGTNYADTITGSSGNDSLMGAGGADSIDGASGDDSISGGEGDDTISGGAGNDSLTGNAGYNTLAGGAGNDSFDCTYGHDTYDASGATKGIQINLTTNSVVQDGFDGADVLSGTLYGVIGSNYADTITGGMGADVLKGGAGNDTVYISSGTDSVYGESGTDTFDASSGGAAQSVAFNLSTGLLSQGASYGATLNGIEIVKGSTYGNNFTAGSGSYTLYGGVGADTVYYASGSGSESFYGESGQDYFSATAGNDYADGGSDTDTFDASNATSGIVANLTTGSVSDGFGGTDTITSFEWLIGSGHDDTIYAASGTVSVVGGNGTDTVSYANSGSGITVTASSSNLIVNSTTTLTDIENLVGSGYADTITLGGAAGEIVNAGAGNDVVQNIGASDSVFGGDGDDAFSIVDGVTSVGTLDGGSGVDILAFTGWTAGATVDLNNFTGIEWIYDTSFADSFTGSSLAETLYASAGNDTFFGNDGADTFVGGAGNDYFDCWDSASSNVTDRILLWGAGVALLGNDTVANFVTGFDEIALKNSTFGLGSSGDLVDGTNYFESATAMSGSATNYGGGANAGLVVIGAATGSGGVAVWYTADTSAADTNNSFQVATLSSLNTTQVADNDFVLAA